MQYVVRVVDSMQCVWWLNAVYVVDSMQCVVRVVDSMQCMWWWTQCSACGGLNAVRVVDSMQCVWWTQG